MAKFKRKKIVNYILMCAFALLWIAAMIQYIRAGHNGSIQSMAGIVENEKLGNKGFVVRCRGMIDTKYYTEEEKKEWLLDAAKKLSVPVDGNLSSERNESTSQVSYSREGANAGAQFKFITMETPVSPEEISIENYMDLEISVDGLLSSAMGFKNALYEYCKENDTECRITVEFMGETDGRLDEEKMQTLSKTFLKELSAKEVSSSFEDGNFNLYAYTDKEEEYILDDGRKVNVNIIMTYNENKDKTEIYLCTPVISSSY